MCGMKCLIHPKLQRFHPTIYLTGDCLSMLRLKLIYVSKWDPGVLYTRLLSINHHQGFLWNHTNWFVVLENPKHTCLSVHSPLRLNYRKISKCPLNISSLGQTSAINVIFVAKTASCIMNYRVAYTHTYPCICMSQQLCERHIYISKLSRNHMRIMPAFFTAITLIVWHRNPTV